MSTNNTPSKSPSSSLKKKMGSFIERMPKVELHAHLSGSVSFETLTILIEDRDRRVDIDHIPATLYNQLQSQFDKENTR